MTLYSCRHDGDQYKITKWDEDLNVVSSYTCDLQNCDCPAGVRPQCRHREMLPAFLQRWDTHGTDWWLDYDRGGWVQMPIDEYEDDIPGTEPLPEGVTMITLDDPAVVHNTIALAVGESEAVITQPAQTKPAEWKAWRRT